MKNLLLFVGLLATLAVSAQKKITVGSADTFYIVNAVTAGDTMALFPAGNKMILPRWLFSAPFSVAHNTGDSLRTVTLNNLDSSRVNGLHTEAYYNSKYAAFGSVGGSSTLSYDTTQNFYYDTVSKKLIVKHGNWKRRFSPADSSAIVTGGGGGGGEASVPLITAMSAFGGDRSNFTAKNGCQITVGGSNVTVTDLGRWIVSGNSLTHTMSIYSPDGATLIASATLNASGKTPDAFAYVSITPTVLTAGTSYLILCDELNGGDVWLDASTASTLNSGITIDGYVYMEVVGSPNFSTAPNAGYGPLNIQFHL